MFQGKRKESEEKNRTFNSFDPEIITNVVLSHAHIDHCGRIPLLIKKNFKGRVITTRATQDACKYLLLDSAHIQESDAQYLNYKTVRSSLYSMQNSTGANAITNKDRETIKRSLKSDHRIDGEAVNKAAEKLNLKKVEPLYTVEEAEKALEYFEGYPYQYPITVGKNITCTFYDAGHILGSAMCLIKAVDNGRTYRVLFSGDVGRFDKPIVNDPTTKFPGEDCKIDLLILESTYGDRVHDPVNELKNTLKEILHRVVKRGGSLVIPSFAFGRTQELVYLLHEIYNEKELPLLPIYVDSPLAGKLTKVFGEHMENYDQLTHDTFLKKGQNPFMFDHIHFIQSVEESMALMNNKKPNVVIAASGMCEAGRILHHLRYKIHNPQNTILFVGYQAENTLGRRILEEGKEYEKSRGKKQAPIMKFMNKTYPLEAHVEEIGGFSAHGDKTELLKFLKQSGLEINKIALVHGEVEQIYPFRDFLKSSGYNVEVPHTGESIKI